MFCLTCDAEKHPVQAFTSKGMVDACPTCQGVFARHEAPLPEEPAEDVPVAAPPPPPPRPAPQKPAAVPDALSLVDQMRARLAVVEAGIAEREHLIAERDMLHKMLAVADAETRPAEPASVFTN